MTTPESPHYKSVSLLRSFRKLHRKVSILLFAFLLLVVVTGLLLGWKKHSGGLLLPDTARGISNDLRTWLPIDSLHQLAIAALHDSVSSTLSAELERIDARPQHGILKFVFADDYWEVQLDGTTGEVLQIARRRSDFIEHLHDGTILDVLLGTNHGQGKLVYTTLIGSSLLTLIITGVWLWYGPGRLKKKKRMKIPR